MFHYPWHYISQQMLKIAGVFQGERSPPPHTQKVYHQIYFNYEHWCKQSDLTPLVLIVLSRLVSHIYIVFRKPILFQLHFLRLWSIFHLFLQKFISVYINKGYLPQSSAITKYFCHCYLNHLWFICLFVCLYNWSFRVETRGRSWQDQPGQNAQARLQKADSMLA